jgi:hypothetical protein
VQDLPNKLPACSAEKARGNDSFPQGPQDLGYIDRLSRRAIYGGRRSVNRSRCKLAENHDALDRGGWSNAKNRLRCLHRKDTSNLPFK